MTSWGLLDGADAAGSDKEDLEEEVPRSGALGNKGTDRRPPANLRMGAR